MNKLHSRFLPVSVLLLASAALAPYARAQAPSVTRVMSDPAGPAFFVDGTQFSQPMAAFWPQGSLHTLWSPYGIGGVTYNFSGTAMYTFQNWISTAGAVKGNPVTVVADPTITQYTAVYSTQFVFTLQLSCASAACSTAPGVVTAGTTPIVPGQPTWLGAGTTLTLQAAPNPGWMVAGWQNGTGQPTSGVSTSVTVSGPTTVTAMFVPTKLVNFATNPPNLQLYADTTLISTPYSLPWGLGTVHQLGGIQVQQDSLSNRWVFASWSDGGAFSHTYTVRNDTLPETVTANYAAAMYPYFMTMPSNLNLVIDGQTLPPPYSFIWGVGSTHTLVAPSQQTDAQGTVWAFKSWDDGVTTASRTLTVSADGSGLRLIAEYTAQARLTVGSSLAGLTVAVDGTPCATPCSVVRNTGATVHVSAPASVPVSDGTRQDFLGWSAGGAAPVAGDWVATLNAPSTSITATYHLMNRLSAVSNPAGGASWNILPASPDSFYDSQTLVNVGVTAQPGYRFSNWSGDLSGTAPAASLAMSAPHQVVAQFNAVPYIAPTSVSNAAGVTPQTGVAAGSIASIFGVNLASATATGPASQLVQTLAGVTVHIGARLLPLYFVSPVQINLQIPPDLAPGPQTVTVSSQGQPDVSANFAIVRNAPGLFPLAVNGQSYALVLHADGTLVTLQAPAQVGELLTLYGTGFGPTDPPRLEGIALPATPQYAISDPVTIQVGGSVFTPESTFAAPGQVGLDLVQFRLDSSAPSGTAAPLYLTVNGVNSNTLSLPIQ